MGSKISGKMAAASRVVQAVRPHTPLIKFPNRQSALRPNVQEALKLAVASPPRSSHGAHGSSASVPSGLRPPDLPSRVPGPPDSAATIKEFPQRYRRRSISLDEMDYIQRGGPE